MAQQTVLLTRQEMAKHLDMARAVPAIEEAMGAYEKGEDYLPPKAIYELPIEEEGALAACITGMTKTANLLTMKLGQERTHNGKRKLPTTVSWVTVFEPVTGELLMICDGTLTTMLRTASAAAVAIKHLARPDSKTLAVIGAGQLGQQCVHAAAAVKKFETVYLHDVATDFAKAMAADLSEKTGLNVVAVDAKTACENADAIMTATNSREPIVMSDWIKPGTHLSCMGTDFPTKIECEMSLLTRARLFADYVEHALQRGEVSQAVEKGVLGKDCFLGSLGQVINGDLVGRTSDQDITIYDGVGIGIQDTAMARAIYDQAIADNLGQRISFS